VVVSAVLVGAVLRSYRQLHERLLRLVVDLSDEQLARDAGGSTNAVGWNLWHVARWADVLQFELATVNAAVAGRVGPPRQIWVQEGLAARWDLPASALGFWETGAEGAQGHAEALPLPGKDRLLDCARRAFAAAEDVVAALEDHHLDEGYTSLVYGNAATYLPTLVTHIAHGNRHLGMIEAQRGALGLRGSATV
jgi:DinB superfamily